MAKASASGVKAKMASASATAGIWRIWRAWRKYHQRRGAVKAIISIESGSENRQQRISAKNG
jgi:hypothetical protein